MNKAAFPEIGYHQLDSSGAVIRGSLADTKKSSDFVYHAGGDNWLSAKPGDVNPYKLAGMPDSYKIKGPKRFYNTGERWEIPRGESKMNIEKAIDMLVESPRRLTTRERITAAVTKYLGTEPSRIDIVDDPRIEGSYAIKASVKRASKPIYFLFRQGAELTADDIEEVEFRTWPPESR